MERVGAPPIEHRNKKKAEQAARKAKNAPAHDVLFNLKDDPAEKNNAHAGNESLMAQLKQKLTEARDRGFTRIGADQ